jgi:PERQ amino acid-rich with GYF domain-containing protein
MFILIITSSRRFQISATPPPLGNPWTVVGSSGKTLVAAVAVPRATITPSTSTLATPGSAPRANGNAVRTVSATPSATKPAPASLQSDEPVPPSHEFLKWLNDSLKGLNSTVNGKPLMN